MFYRLAMKANNETAVAFQGKVADEVLPSIREHGAYMTFQVIEKALTDPDTIIRLAMDLKKERLERLLLENQRMVILPKVFYLELSVRRVGRIKRPIMIPNDPERIYRQ
jgi:anti-repressor protein